MGWKQTQDMETSMITRYCPPLCLALALSCGLANGLRAQEPAEAILGRLAEACARSDSSYLAEGKATYSWVTSMHMTPISMGTFQCFGDGKQSYMHTDLPGIGSFERGSDGDILWQIDPAMGALAAADETTSAANQRLMTLLTLADCSEFYAENNLKGKSKIRGRQTQVLHRMPAMGSADVWYIDLETNLPSRVIIEVPDGKGGSDKVQVDFDDWREHKGEQIPFTQSMSVAHARTSYRIEKVERGAKAPAEIIFLPEAIIAVLDAAESSAQKPSLPQIRIDRVEEVPTATIRMVVDMSELSNALGEILPEVHSYLTQNNVLPVAAPFARYHSMEDGKVDLEAGMRVPKPIPGKGRIKASTLPAGKVVTSWHVGPYHELGNTHTRMTKWIAEQGLKTRGGTWEVYWTDPGMEPNPAKWQTELLMPVQSK